MFYYNNYTKSDVIIFSAKIAEMVAENFANQFEQIKKHKSSKKVLSSLGIDTLERKRIFAIRSIELTKKYSEFQNEISNMVGYNATAILEGKSNNVCKIANRHNFVSAISYHYFTRVATVFASMINAIDIDKLIVSKAELKDALLGALKKELEDYLLMYLELDIK